MTAVSFPDGPRWGLCNAGCGRPAAHQVGAEVVCRACLPKNILFAPFLGPQQNFMSRTERYVLFGGGAGPGKTDCALRDWIRQWAVEHGRFLRGEIEYSTGWAIYFRRQLPELAQSIERFRTFYKKLDAGAVWNENAKTCTFSCGYKVQFGGMEHEQDWEKYYGPEYTHCVEVGTQVRMADGTLRPIEALTAGDLVQTLEGPRPVSFVSTPRRKPCVIADVDQGLGVAWSQVHPVDHPILTIAEAFDQDRMPSSQGSGPVDAGALSWTSYESLLSARPGTPAIAAWSAGAGTDSAAFGGSPRAARQPPALTVQAVLYAPTAPRCPLCSGAGPTPPTPRDGTRDEPSATGRLEDSSDRCRAADGSRGGRLPAAAGAGAASSPPPGCAAERIPSCPPGDGRSSIHARTHLCLGTYFHPYTSEERQVSVGVTTAACSLTPIGERDVVDVTIKGASHYITSVGLINRNCTFDEATQFTVEQIEQLDTRLRSTDPVLGKMLAFRLVTNPVGAETKLWLRRRYVEAAPPGQVVRLRVKLRDGRQLEERQVYIPANIYDNPAILEDGRYEANLLRKSAVMRRALLDNDWYVDAESWVGEDWDPRVHICKPFVIPTGWYRFKSADYGFASNASVQWWAVDTENNMTCYRSLTVKGHTAEELGMRIREIERHPLKLNGLTITGPEWDPINSHSTVWGPMDSSLWARVGESGPSRGEMLDNIGCGFFKADRGPGVRYNAAEQFRNRLRRRTPNAKGEAVIPGIRWFDTCKTVRRDKDGRREETGPIITIPVLQCDENDPDVPDTTGDDHDWDAAAYGCQYRALVPESDDVDPNAAFYDELASRRGGAGQGGGGGAASGWPGGY